MKKKIVIGGIVIVLIGVGIFGIKTRNNKDENESLTPKKAAKEIYGKGKLKEIDKNIIRNMKAENLGLDEAYDINSGRALIMEVKGAKDNMKVMVGFDNKGTIVGVRVLEHKDTPAIGGKVANSDFIDKFTGNRLDENLEVEAVSRATITSESIIKAVNNSKEVYRETYKK